MGGTYFREGVDVTKAKVGIGGILWLKPIKLVIFCSRGWVESSLLLKYNDPFWNICKFNYYSYIPFLFEIDQLLTNKFFQRSNMISYEINWRASWLINEPNWIIYHIIRLAKKHIYIPIIKIIIVQNACVYLQTPNVDFLQQTVTFCITLILCYLRLWVWIRIKWVVKLSLINQLMWALQSRINSDLPI